MPAKKTVKTAAKKTTAKKAAAPKKEAVKEPEVKKEETVSAVKEAPKAAEKKPVKKAAAKKPAAKKPAKKAAPKKAAPKKETVQKPVVNKKTVKDYEDVINWKKGEAHAMDWLYIEINAGDLLTEVEAGVDNLATACNAILNCMLEGDGFIVDPSEPDKVSDTLTVRYYCDNLSEDRKKYFDR